MKNIKKRTNKHNIIFKMLLLIFLYFVQQLPVTLLGTAISAGTYQNANARSFISIAFVIVSILVLGLMIYLLNQTQSFVTKHWNWRSLSWIVGGLVSNYLINTILLPFMKTTGNSNVQAQTDFFKTFPAMFILYAVLIAPVTEELFFRGYLINWFFKDHLYTGVIVSAILFGLVHVSSDPIYFLSKFLLGLVLGIVYIKTQNIKSDIALHFLNNIMAFFIG